MASPTALALTDVRHTLYRIGRLVWRLPRLALVGLVRVYQLVLSPHLGASCRFAPSCSHYAVEALRQYGAVRGSALVAWRLLRCNPWGGHGYDPPRWFGEPLSDVRDEPAISESAHELRRA